MIFLKQPKIWHCLNDLISIFLKGPKTKIGHLQGQWIKIGHLVKWPKGGGDWLQGWGGNMYVKK